MRTVFLALTIAVLGLCSTAQAHFQLVSPPAVIPADPNGKGSPPCGPDTGAAATPTSIQGGHPLNLTIKETVPHDGFYRVALALKSRSEFPVDNAVYDAAGKVLPADGSTKGTSDHADFENPAVFPVLADNLFKHVGTGAMTFPSTAVPGTVMVPNVNCDRCILQVIEFMRPHPFNTSVPGPGGGYFYHHCAEVKITADPALPIFNPAGSADGGTNDAGPKDAASEASATGAAGSGSGGVGAGGAGVAGSGGGGGSVTTGAAGSNSTGAAGNTTGLGGTTGTAGTGSPTGVAGTTGAAGARTQGSSGGGGCALRSPAPRGAPLALIGMLVAVTSFRRRKR